MAKLKDESWADLPRQSKLAAAMYPDKIPENIRREMVAANPGMASRVGVEPERRSGRWKVPLTADNLSRVPHLVKRR